MLWRWAPAGNVPGVLDDVVGWVTRGVDGTMFFLAGSEDAVLVALRPDRSVAWHGAVGYTRWAPTALPDGRVALSDGSGVHIWASDGSADGAIDLPEASLAVGPNGRLYAITRDTLVATCQGRDVLWTLRGPLGELEFDHRVRVDGVMEAIRTGPPISIHPDGTITDDPFAPPVPPGAVGTYHRTAGTTLYAVYSNGEGTVDLYMGVGGAEPWPIPLSRDLALAGAFVDGLGGVWAMEQRVRWTRYAAPSSPSFERADFELGELHGRGEDGSLIVGGSSVRRVSSETGDTMWEVEVGREATVGSSSSVELTPGGMVIFGSAAGIVAVQTDVLPPEEETCVLPACNARHDRAWALFR